VPGVEVLDIYIEPRKEYQGREEELETFIYNQIMRNNDIHVEDMINFKVKIHFLEKGFFADYSLRKQQQGADLAHIKPPHMNPKGEILDLLLNHTEENIVIKQ
jgi:hypothetical protein